MEQVFGSTEKQNKKERGGKTCGMWGFGFDQEGYARVLALLRETEAREGEPREVGRRWS